ncbi:hypothetical protein L1887_36023 [Cichorium endivia]|nr:hypothetical protein L1887_36023 [Cichorium endivia]
METEKSTKRSASIRMILPRKKKNYDDGNANVKNNRFLIIVNVVGSSGPLRLVVNQDDKVSTVINSSLKLYARGGRLPVLGSDFKDFMLYASIEGSAALNPSEEIGSCRGRNFVLCKKSSKQGNEKRSRIITRQHSGRWKGCLLCLAQ